MLVSQPHQAALQCLFGCAGAIWCVEFFQEAGDVDFDGVFRDTETICDELVS